MYSQLERACYLCRAIEKSKCRAVQRTVVPGNWMDNRQSDNFIVPLKESNASVGKGVVCGNILEGNLCNTQWFMKKGNAFQEECWKILWDLSGNQPHGEPGAGKLHAGIYRGRISWGARLPTKAARPVPWGWSLVRGSSTRPAHKEIDVWIQRIQLRNKACIRLFVAHKRMVVIINLRRNL